MTRSPSGSERELERIFQSLDATADRSREALAQSSKALWAAQTAISIAQDAAELALSSREALERYLRHKGKRVPEAPAPLDRTIQAVRAEEETAWGEYRRADGYARRAHGGLLDTAERQQLRNQAPRIEVERAANVRERDSQEQRPMGCTLAKSQSLPCRRRAPSTDGDDEDSDRALRREVTPLRGHGRPSDRSRDRKGKERREPESPPDAGKPVWQRVR